MHSAKKVAINTVILYVKMITTICIVLYSTRIVLNVLGVSDYGVYNLVAGVIAMLSFLNSAMTVSTQRFLSFYKGKKDIEVQRKVFINSLVLHILIGLLVSLVLFLIGDYLFEGFLNINKDRIAAAKSIYNFMSVTVFFTIIAVPFNASLNANEEMLWSSIIGILEAVMKLAIAFALLLFSVDSKLEMYGILTACVTVVSFCFYAIICVGKYGECKITFSDLKKTDYSMMGELGSFAGWNLFGTLCVLARTQGLAVLLNIYFGTIVNASYAIANQAGGQLKFFSANMLSALNPQIMKSEGANDRDRMLRLSMIASKFGYFLLAFISIPTIFEMETILKLWLNKVPEYSVVFCQLVLVAGLANQLTIGLQSAVQATGKIKLYQSVVGTILLLNMPVALVLMKFGYPAYSVMVSFIFIELVACIARLFFLKSLSGLSIMEYFQRVIVREIIPTTSILVICYLITSFLHFEYRFLITFPVSISIFLFFCYTKGLCEDEKGMVDKLVNKLLEGVFSKLNLKK